MDKFYKKLFDLSKSNISVKNKLKNRMHDKQLLNQVKAILDQKKIDAKSNIYSQVNTARLWMEEFTGLDKVHAAQNDVFHYQNEFIKSQNKRRELGTKLTSLQMELNDLHNDIVTTNKSDEKYLHLITQEHKLLKLENQLRNEFTLMEAEERENFTLFTTKIKESQDKEREQALRTKYWTLIVSTGVTLLGVLGNGVISFFKMHKIDKTIFELGQETRTLSENIHADISKLNENHSLMLQLLTPDQSGTRKNSMYQTNLEPLQRTLKQLIVLTTQHSGKTEMQLTGLTANQAALINGLKQISKELDQLNTTQRELRNDFLVEKKRSDQLFRNSSNTSGVTNDLQSRSGSNSLAGISIDIAKKPSSVGSGEKQTPSGGYKKIEAYSMSGDSLNQTSDAISWKKTLVYFGIFSAVYILASSGLLF